MDRCPNCGHLLVPSVRKTLAQSVSDTRDADIKYLRETYGSVSTKDELVAAVIADYEAKYPAMYKAVTKEEAIKLALDAWGKYLP